MLESTCDEQTLTRAVHEEDLAALVRALDDYEDRFPCDGACYENQGPTEDCSAHGRTPTDLWRIIDTLRGSEAALQWLLPELRARGEIIDTLTALCSVLDTTETLNGPQAADLIRSALGQEASRSVA